MRRKLVEWFLVVFYTAVSVLAGVFYQYAVFWKPGVRAVGKLLLFLSCVLLISFLALCIKHKKVFRALYISGTVITACIHGAACVCWLIYAANRTTWYIGGQGYVAKPMGGVVHLIIMVAGIYMIDLQTRPKEPTEVPELQG